MSSTCTSTSTSLVLLISLGSLWLLQIINSHTTQTLQQKNKDLVLRGLQVCFGDKKVEEVDNYFHQDYFTHDPDYQSGADAVRDFILNDRDPPRQLDIRRVAADDDLVWIHMKYTFEGKDYAVIDIWRVEDGKIKEQWGLSKDMELKEPSTNPQPFF